MTLVKVYHFKCHNYRDQRMCYGIEQSQLNIMQYEISTHILMQSENESWSPVSHGLGVNLLLPESFFRVHPTLHHQHYTSPLQCYKLHSALPQYYTTNTKHSDDLITVWTWQAHSPSLSVTWELGYDLCELLYFANHSHLYIHQFYFIFYCHEV